LGKIINLNELGKLYINKKNLLEEISDENIFRYFIKDLQIGKIMSSPLRRDKNPSFGVYYYKGTLFYNDFGLKSSGDCIKFVSKLFNISYKESISKIALDFGLENKYLLDKSAFKTNVIGDFVKSNKRTYTHKSKIINITVRDWKQYDIDYWKQYGITISILNAYNVYPIKFLFINDNVYPVDSYAYAYREEKDNIISYKIYQPYSIYKWISNHNKTIHQGYIQLPHKGELLIITKSLKDIMSLCNVMNIPSIGIQNETVIAKKSVIKEYQERFKKVIILFDNDTTGIIHSFRYKTMYNLPFIILPYKYGCKDFSDLVKQYGAEKSKRILKNLLNESNNK
jgi:hypothetical protein